MTREEEILFIKENVKIFDLIQQAGIKWWKAGLNKVKIRSLINYDKNPSCIIYTDKNDFYDFSANRGGSVIDFYMYLTGKDYVSAIKDLRNLAGLNGNKGQFEIRLNDYTEVRKEFENLMDLVMSLREKTKYLREIKEILKQKREEIARKEILSD